MPTTHFRYHCVQQPIFGFSHGKITHAQYILLLCSLLYLQPYPNLWVLNLLLWVIDYSPIFLHPPLPLDSHGRGHNWWSKSTWSHSSHSTINEIHKYPGDSIQRSKVEIAPAFRGWLCMEIPAQVLSWGLWISLLQNKGGCTSVNTCFKGGTSHLKLSLLLHFVGEGLQNKNAAVFDLQHWKYALLESYTKNSIHPWRVSRRNQG